jgi:Peptidase family M23
LRKIKLCVIFIAPISLAIYALPSNAFLNYKSPFKAGVIDWIRGAPEGGSMDPGTEFLSGSVVRRGGKDVNSPVPCTSKKCQHIEFSDIAGVSALLSAIPGGIGQNKNPLSVLGHRWEVGPDHIVPGGFGFLAVGPLGLEPTGRLVVQGIDGPAAIKIVLVSLNEQRGTALFQGYGRNCVKVPYKGWISCTAFNIPLPMFYFAMRGTNMPVDIKITGNMPNPLALTDKAKAVQTSFASKLKQNLLAQGLSLGTGVIGSDTGGGGGGSSGGGSSAPTVPATPVSPVRGGGSGVFNGTFNGVTINPIPSGYTVTSPFGWRIHPIHGTRRFHDGIDLAASTGTPVLSVAAGKITFQGNRGGYGKTIIVDHGNGYSSLYGHLNGYLQGGVGTLVPAGAPIGVVGSTGDSTGPHLHLNIQRNGNNIDPRSFIRGL